MAYRQYVQIPTLPLGNPVLSSNQAGTAPTTRSLAAVDNGVVFRFRAIDTRDIKGVWLNWQTVTTPGTVEVTIEPTDSAYEPTGTPYDASATLTATPTAGWQFFQFATLPTTGLTAGSIYHVVVRGATVSTTLAINSYRGAAVLPACEQQNADITPRSNVTLTASSVPVCSLVMEDDEEIALEINFTPCATATSGQQVYTHRFSGNWMKFDQGIWVDGICATRLNINSSAGDCYFEIRDALVSTSPLVSGCQVVMPRLTWTTAVYVTAKFAAPVFLPPGEYYVGVRQNNTGSSTNRYQFDRAPTWRSVTGTGQSGSTSTTIRLTAGASAVNDFYNSNWVYITGGTGSGQRRKITDYDGSTKDATVDTAWAVTPDNTSTYELIPCTKPPDVIMAETTDISAGSPTWTLTRSAMQFIQPLLAEPPSQLQYGGLSDFPG